MSEAVATPVSLKADIVHRIQMGKGLVQADLNAMTEEMLCSCPGGKARCAYDLVFEMSMLNRAVANNLRGESGGLPSPEGWVRAPREYHVKSSAIKDLGDSTDELLSAFESVPEEKLAQEIDTPIGKMTIGRLMTIMGAHLMYHSGQLNYIQTIHGDDAFHWAEA